MCSEVFLAEARLDRRSVGTSTTRHLAVKPRQLLGGGDDDEEDDSGGGLLGGSSEDDDSEASSSGNNDGLLGGLLGGGDENEGNASVSTTRCSPILQMCNWLTSGQSAADDDAAGS